METDTLDISTILTCKTVDIHKCFCKSTGVAFACFAMWTFKDTLFSALFVLPVR